MESLNKAREYQPRAILKLLLILLLAVAFLLPAALAQTDKISPQALNQIRALVQEKQNRTFVQQKISSQIVYEIKSRRGEFLGTDVPKLHTGINVDDQNRTKVSIRAHVSDALIGKLKALGVDVENSTESLDSIAATVPLDKVEAVASLPEVRFVAREFGYMTQTRKPTVDTNTAFALRAANVRKAISAALLTGSSTNVTGIPAPTGQGSQTSEGDLTHRAVDARNTFHVDGTGIRIGVLSNGVVSLAQSQALGDLGPVTVIPGQTGTGDEGTAMLEIIHDLAPGAQLFFATANGGIANFANNVRLLRNTYNCDIIVDDVFYFVETPFQDGQNYASELNGAAVIQAVKDVTAAGALYFSSAGNEGNVAQNTAGVWEGDFKSGGAATGVLAGAGTVHDFGGPTLFDTLVTSGGNPIILHWSDPLGSSSNDYDLYALNAAGTAIVAASTDAQTGTQDPLEGFNAPPAGSRLVIVKWSGADRFLHLNTFRGTLSKFTSGQTHGHSAVDSVGAYGVAATPALGPFGNSAAGPYPNGFNSSNQTETFESDGRRRIFYDNTGTAITPGNVSSTGGKLLNKPDITAADGVSVTGVGGFGSPFYGTSAASPHAGAIAALIKQALPGLTQTQFRNLLTSTAVDIGPAGFDINSGAGIIRAWNALFSGGATGTADIEPGTINAIENPGDGDGAINTGEGASVSIQLKSVGTQAANSVVGTLTSSTPGVTIFMPNATSYGNLAAVSGTGTKSFKFTVGSTVPCPAVLDFTLTVTYTGGPSPKLINFKVPIGTVPIAINGTLDATASPSTAYWTSTTGLQQGRLTRNGVASSCGSLKPFPGLLATTGDRRYDAYAFKTCANSVASCATVNLQGSGAASMFGVNYLGTFNPASISTNYLADPGISSGNISWSFPLGAGVQNFTSVVHEVNPGGATGQSYKLSITGACINSCVINHPPVAKAKDVTVTSGFGCVANANVNDGSYDPDPGDTITVTQNPPGPYPVGVTPVILTVTDSKGAFSQTTANVTVLAASQSSLSAAVIYVPPVKARITFTDLVYASCAKVAPTGTVTFTDTKTNTVLGTVPLSSSGKIGQATLTIERVRPVNMSVKATYSGDSATAGSSAGPKLVFAY